MDHALRTNPNVTKPALRERAELLAKFRGIADARASIELATGKAQTVLETLARLRLMESPLVRMAEEQVEFELPNGRRVWVDQRVNGRLLIELDGEWKYDGAFHKPSDHVLREERRRENALRQLGHTLLRFTYTEVRTGIMRRQVKACLGKERT